MSPPRPHRSRVRAATLDSGPVLRIGGLLLLAGSTLMALAMVSGCVVSTEESPLAAQVDRPLELSVAAEPGLGLRVENLAGRVTVEAADGDTASISAIVHAGGDDEAVATELADVVELEIERSGGLATVHVRYPLDRGREIHYPGDSDGFVLFGFDLSSSSVEYQGREVTVTSRRGSDTMSLWVDLVIRVPAGMSTDVANAVGALEGISVDADLVLGTQSGDITLTGGAGAAQVSTGSGDVEIDGWQGTVSASTGSGDVRAAGVAEDLGISTGSGDVLVERAGGPSVKVRTGSGDVRLDEVRGAVDVGTGSGSVDGTDLELRDALSVRTGSGDIDLEGNASGLAEARLEAGSGDVRMVFSGLPATEFRLYTSAGDIDVDLPGLTTTMQDDEALEGHTGEAPRVRMEVETRSGDITVRGSR